MTLHRRAFLAAAGATLGLRTERWSSPGQSPATTLVGGTVYDGTGASPYSADVVLRGGRIATIARGAQYDGDVLDIHGLALAPGFIDVHSHTDRELLVDPRAESKIRQGVTTEVAGQDGGSIAPSTDDADSFPRLSAFFDAVEDSRPAVNFASMVGHGTIRREVLGLEARDPSTYELTRMTALVEQALEDGACGLSSGLEYIPGAFATLDELVALARPLVARHLPYSSHIRNEDDQLLSAVEEAIMVGSRSGAPVHIAHLKAQGARNWWKADAALGMIEHANARGRSVTFDRYPYVAYSTGLSSLFPTWAREGGSGALQARLEHEEHRGRIEAFTRDKIALLGSWDAVQIRQGEDRGTIGHIDGRRLGELAVERGEDPYELLRAIMREDAGTGMIGFGMSEDNTARILAHPRGMVCSDGSALAIDGPLGGGTPHPRSFGTFPRVLGHYVREQGVMSLADAIRKMTFAPATLLRLNDRGHVAIGAAADIVVFDPLTIADRATFADPKQYPVGITHVFVNGVAVLRDGQRTDARPGHILRPSAGQARG